MARAAVPVGRRLGQEAVLADAERPAAAVRTGADSLALAAASAAYPLAAAPPDARVPFQAAREAVRKAPVAAGSRLGEAADYLAAVDGEVAADDAPSGPGRDTTDAPDNTDPNRCRAKT